MICHMVRRLRGSRPEVASSRSNRFSSSAARRRPSRRPRWRRSAIKIRFSSPVSRLSTAENWPVTPIAARTESGSRATSWPATRTSPPSAPIKVERICTVVVLPAPLGPSSAKIVPSGTSRSMPSSTTWSPNDLRNVLALIAGRDGMVVILPRLGTVALVATTSPSMHDARFTPVSPRFQPRRRTAADRAGRVDPSAARQREGMVMGEDRRRARGLPPVSACKVRKAGRVMVKRLSEDARKLVLTAAADEARRRGDRRLGTDHLLLGLLHDPAAEAASALGVDLASARAAQDALDRAALAAVGIHAGDLGPIGEPGGAHRRPPLTSGARAVFKRAVEQAHPRKSGRIGTRHFLLALLACQRPDPAAELLHELGVDPAVVRDRLTG